MSNYADLASFRSERADFLVAVRDAHAAGTIGVNCSNADIEGVAIDAGWAGIPLWFRTDSKNDLKVGRGKYDLSRLVNPVDTGNVTAATEAPAAATVSPTAAVTPDPLAGGAALLNSALVAETDLIPARDKDFVPFGFYADAKTIIGSRQFFPMFITGLSGNGKTTGLMQACAELQRAFYRCNITSMTDEDDLLGGFRLVETTDPNGNSVTVMKWFDGPVVQAMRTGGVLLLDEVDLGGPALMCLQPVLEGKGIFIKKINQFVSPAPGFTVVATANTKGKGDDSGAFSHTGILNEAFLDRFPVTFEHDYATVVVEKKILLKKMKTLNCVDKDFVTCLTKWAAATRKTFKDGGTSEVISTRRLLTIVQSYSIFNDRMKAVTMSLTRFDDETSADFMKLYEKIDATVYAPPAAVTPDSGKATIVSDSSKCPF